jgi:hypothetical protein
MENTLRDDTGLAASRARNDEQWSFTVFNRLELFRVELQHESNQVNGQRSKVYGQEKCQDSGFSEKP